MAKMNISNKTAIITGAGGGIGRGISVSLAQRQCHVILTDINEQGLEETANLIKPLGVKVSCAKVDVSDKESIANFAQKIHAEHEQIDVLVNNAGVALSGTFDQVAEDDFEWLMNINFYGVVRMTRAFMDLLQKSDDARIINISSIFGIIAPPGQTAYSSSKFAVRGFSESLRHELTNTNIGVTQVHPGGVSTDIANNSRHPAGTDAELIEKQLKEYNKQLVLPPAVAGETIVRGMVERRDRVIVGNDARLIAAITRTFPVRYWKILDRLFTV